MPYPKKIPGVQFCIRVSEDGVTVYGNKKAFQAFTRWMAWIAKSPEHEHYECHLPWHLRSMSSLNGTEPENVWVVMDKKVKSAFTRKSRSHAGFDLSFMMVEQSDLDHLRPPQSAPKNKTKARNK
jgi:hypothetical protein